MSRQIKLLIGCAVLLPLLVCCTGVFSALAIPAFLSFTVRSKAVEARSNLAQLEAAVRSRCEQGQASVPAGPLPLTISAEKQNADFSADAGFVALGFTPLGPVYYRYSVVLQSDGSTALRAEGDLNANGTLSLFEITCASDCTCTPLHIAHELE